VKASVLILRIGKTVTILPLHGFFPLVELHGRGEVRKNGAVNTPGLSPILRQGTLYMAMTIEKAAEASQKVLYKGSPRFYRVLRARIDEYFAGRNRRDDPRLYCKAVIVLSWFVISFGLLLGSSHAGLQVLLCLSTALAACAIGLNIFHDSIHQSFSANPTINLFLARSACAVLGVSRYFWQYKHNVLHHRFTNVFQWDDDLETRGCLRMSPRQPWDKKFKHQHVYCWFLYALATIEWIFMKDFVHYFTMRINQYQPYPPMSSKEKIEFWVSKGGYGSLFVLMPFFFQPFWKCVAGLVIFHLALGLSVTLIFNLAHVMEKSSFPEPQGEISPSFDSEWAALQLATTVNFGRTNAWLTWFSGGLNYQIEHHLFPKVSHTHYPEISAILKNTAEEFHLPYHEYPTYASALKSHYRALKHLNEPPRKGFSLVPQPSNPPAINVLNSTGPLH
jgi:linoleoyl-CoA desaturase